MRVSPVLLLIIPLAACPGAKPTIGFFRALPAEIDAGQSVQLSWETSNAPTCTLTPGPGVVAADGATLVNPTASTRYTLDCEGQTAVVDVVVRAAPQPRITDFTASPAMTTADSPVELTWAAQNVSGCRLDPGLGQVAAAGTRVVQAAQTTTYTLSCGTATATTTVTIVPVTTLDPPTGVMVTAGDGTLRVSWAQTAGSANLYLAEAAGIEISNIDTKPGGVVHRRITSPFTLSGLVNGRTYYLRLSAISGSTESVLTAEVSAVPMGVAGTDPYFTQQWHLADAAQEGVNVAATWAAGGKGEGVYAAIVDDGVDLAHEDLRQNVATGLSHDYSPTRSAEYGWHGTCVSGLLGARDSNNVGVRGVAPRVSLMGFSVLEDLTSANEYDAMTRQKALVGVSNNSWGDAYDQTGQLTFPDPEWLRGVREGATTGRNGKGVVYFWASGNGADPAGTYVDDSNYDSQANSRFVIAVGGVGKDGKRPAYAEGGANVLIVAPTEGDDLVMTTTTDVTGTGGYNSGTEQGEHADVNYSATMSGTSGSTPLAAGVGALVLQARPDLSYRDVRRVLAHSARKVDPSSPGWTNNGAGLHVSHDYGFGVVDANAAVALARTITLVGPELTASAMASPAQSIPDNNATGVSSAVTVSGSGINKVEVVEIEVTIVHNRSADLEIVLAHGGGASSVLHTPHRCERDQGFEVCTDLDAWVFSSVRNLDEPADGTWTLTVRDRTANNTGTLSNWKLRVYGSQ